jgi:ABC-type uncharacterized transport system substrate-binding protein
MEDRYELRKWLMNYQWINPFAVTLTFKQKLNGISLDKYIAQKQVKNFITRLSTKIFGNNYKRRKQKLNRIATAETDHRLHYHLFIDLPNYKQTQAEDLIKQTWNPKVIDFAYNQQKIEEITSQNGWLKYITKFKNTNDELDLTNTYLDPSKRQSIRQ